MILAEHKAKALGIALLHRNEEIIQKLQEMEAGEVGGDCVTYVIGSDTIVDLEGSILEKPVDEKDAKNMLSRLAGQWHKVHTGVSIYSSSNQYETPVSSFTETAEVKFADLTPADIDAYINTREPMDKAGSYGIQGIGGQIVECIQGDFFAVMGLPCIDYLENWYLLCKKELRLDVVGTVV